MTENTILFETEVGSAAWRMNHAMSDSDRFVCYQMPTSAILRGRVKLIPRQHPPDPPEDLSDQIVDGNAHFSPGTGEGSAKIDRSSFELNMVVNEILKNNANFIWGVFSPIRHYVRDQDWFNAFRDLCGNCMSKTIYHPINGMAMHNKAKYYDTGKDKGWRRDKTANAIVRTCNFGVAVLEGRGFQFEPTSGNDVEQVEDALARLKDARDKSKLPDRPTEYAEYGLREFLFRTRVRALNDEMGVFR